MSQDKPVLSPCPFCGSTAEVVHASHIRCINTYNCDCETRLGEKAWNRRALSALERQGSGWISVKERLPIEGEGGSDDVLVWTQEGYYGMAMWHAPQWYIGGEVVSVTHWMPLPPAPPAQDAQTGEGK